MAKSPDRSLSASRRKSYDVQWQKSYDKLVRYETEHGNCLVPATFQKDPALGNWVNWQRALFRQGILRQDRKRLLEQIGFVFDLNSRSKKTARVKTLPSSKVDEDDKDDTSTAAATTTATATTTPSVSTTKASPTRSSPRKSTARATPKATPLWHTRYQELADFYRQHGHCNVQSMPQAYTKHRKLLYWMSRQRQRRQTTSTTAAAYDPLSQEQIQLLEQIHFDWTPVDRFTRQWNQRLELLQQYQQQHGHCNVPYYYHVDSFNLGAWVNLQRNRYRKQELQPERIQQLQHLGFQWQTTQSDNHSDTNEPQQTTNDTTASTNRNNNNNNKRKKPTTPNSKTTTTPSRHYNNKKPRTQSHPQQDTPSRRSSTRNKVSTAFQVGDQVDVYWSGDEQYYTGIITRQRLPHLIRVYYEDGDKEWVDTAKGTCVRRTPSSEPDTNDTHDEYTIGDQIQVYCSSDDEYCPGTITLQKSPLQIHVDLQQKQLQEWIHTSLVPIQPMPLQQQQQQHTTTATPAVARKEPPPNDSPKQESKQSNNRPSAKATPRNTQNKKPPAHNDDSSVSSSSPPIQIGDAVHVYWSSEDEYCRGTVMRQRAPNQFHIHYEGGGKEWIDAAHLVPIASKKKLSKLKVGDTISVLRQGDYCPGTIVQRKPNNQIHVVYTNGDKEWLDPTRCRIRIERRNQTATRMESTTPTFFGVGDRVAVFWDGDGVYYPGTVLEETNHKIKVQYDVGDSKWHDVSKGGILLVASNAKVSKNAKAAPNHHASKNAKAAPNNHASKNAKAAPNNHASKTGHNHVSNQNHDMSKTCQNGIQVGNRVSVYWSDDDHSYPGTVTQQKGPHQLRVDYDGGGRQWVDAGKTRLRLLEETTKEKRDHLGGILVGDRVSVWWPLERQYYDATVSKIETSKAKPFFLEYDDGDTEWIDLTVQKYKRIAEATK